MLVTDIVDGRATQDHPRSMNAVLVYLCSTIEHQTGEFADIQFICETLLTFERRGYIPGIDIYHALLATISNPRASASRLSTSRGKLAWDILCRMEASGITPTAATFAHVFDAIAGSSHNDAALVADVEQHMFDLGIDYDVQMAKQSVLAFCSACMFTKAAQRIEDITTYGVTPSIELYQAMFDAAVSPRISPYAARLNALYALQHLWWNMKRDHIIANQQIYESVLRCCLAAKDQLMALTLCDEMALAGISPSSAILDTLAEIGGLGDDVALKEFQIALDRLTRR
eukprot:jgi/Hompol1/4478/HPOL_003668-RA